MSNGFSESDWKILRELRQIALDRFCRRLLSEITDIGSQAGKTDHERSKRMSQFVRSSVLACVLILLVGCAPLKRLGHARFQATPESLVGRWSVVDKDTDEENPGAKEMKAHPLGGSAAIIYEFKADHTAILSTKVKYGIIPAPEQNATSQGKWNVVDVNGDSLIIEFNEIAPGVRPRAKVIFENKDRCTYRAANSDDEEPEVLVLTRIP
jgi:hypothetical protein